MKNIILTNCTDICMITLKVHFLQDFFFFQQRCDDSQSDSCWVLPICGKESLSTLEWLTVFFFFHFHFESFSGSKLHNLKSHWQHSHAAGGSTLTFDAQEKTRHNTECRDLYVHYNIKCSELKECCILLWRTCIS